MNSTKNMYAILPLIPRIIIIAIVASTYYYINTHYLFTQWEPYLYYGVKIIIAYQILRASARTMLAPILTVIAAFLLLFIDQIFQFETIHASDALQLIIVAIIGFFVLSFSK